MKLEYFLSKHIQTYPMVFKLGSLEESSLIVLNYVFFDNNRFELTKDGYIIEQNRVHKPYGKIKFKKIPPTYFEDRIFYTGIFPTGVQVNAYGRNKCIYARVSKNSPAPTYLEIDNSNQKFEPSFFNEHSLVYKICENNEFLQQDWKDGLQFLMIKSLEYFKNGDFIERELGKICTNMKDFEVFEQNLNKNRNFCIKNLEKWLNSSNFVKEI